MVCYYEKCSLSNETSCDHFVYDHSKVVYTAVEKVGVFIFAFFSTFTFYIDLMSKYFSGRLCVIADGSRRRSKHSTTLARWREVSFSAFLATSGFGFRFFCY